MGQFPTKIDESFVDTTPSSCALGTVCGDVQVPFATLSSRVNALVTKLKTSISNYGKQDSESLTFAKEIRDMKTEARATDVMFEEEEMRLQVNGVRSRRQTLQEFVLLFFFTAYAILSAAIILYAYNEKGGNGALQALIGMLVLVVVISGFILQLA